MSKKDIEVIDVSGDTSLAVALNEVLNADKVIDTENSIDSGENDTESNNTTVEKEVNNVEVNCDEDPELFFFEAQNITRSSPFDPQTDDGEESFPVRGTGQIDNILVQAQSDTFKVFLRIDDDNVIDDKQFSQLQNLSQELTHISAYQRSSGDYILSITDYPFKKEVKFSLSPTQQTTFDLIRPELRMEDVGNQ